MREVRRADAGSGDRPVRHRDGEDIPRRMRCRHLGWRGVGAAYVGGPLLAAVPTARWRCQNSLRRSRWRRHARRMDVRYVGGIIGNIGVSADEASDRDTLPGLFLGASEPWLRFWWCAGWCVGSTFRPVAASAHARSATA